MVIIRKVKKKEKHLFFRDLQFCIRSLFSLNRFRHAKLALRFLNWAETAASPNHREIRREWAGRDMDEGMLDFLFQMKDLGLSLPNTLASPRSPLPPTTPGAAAPSMHALLFSLLD